MKAIDVDDTTTTLEQLVEMVEAGNEVMVMRDGKPIAKLVLIGEAAKPVDASTEGSPR